MEVAQAHVLVEEISRNVESKHAHRDAPSPRWVFLSFVHLFVDFDEIVGGEHVRPYELFTSLAALGHDVHIFERHRQEGPVRRRGSLLVRPLPVPGSGLLRKLLFWPTLYSIFFREVRRARAAGLRVCLYQTLPWGALDIRRIILWPAFLLFKMAPHFGVVTWGALHDLPLDHFVYGRTLAEQSRREDSERKLAYRAANIQIRQVRHAHFVTVVSEIMRRLIVERAGVPADKVAVFRSAVNLDQVENIPEWTPPEGRPWRIGFLGHAADAHLPILVDAIDLIKTDVDIELVLAGDGTPELRPDSRTNVRCAGDVRYKDFAAFASEMDLWVIPYDDVPYLHLAWQLKPPMNVASGRPVVMTRTDETPHSGLEPYLHLAGHTPASVAASIDDVLKDPHAAAERARRGRHAVLSEMTWRDSAVRLVDRLNEAI